MIDVALLTRALALSPKPWEIECTDRIDSTNLELCRRYSNSHEVPRLLLWSQEQTEGRGRLNRSWLSVPGLDITASAIFPSPVPRAAVTKLSLCAGVALVRVLAGEYGLSAMVRWPNDVLTSNGKLAGILSSYLAGPNAVVCGIGINVNSRPEAIELDQYGRRTTLMAEIGREISREKLLASWLLAFEEAWELARDDRARELADAFDPVSFYRGRRVRVLVGAGMDREEDVDCERFEGVAGSLDRQGALLVERSDGSRYSMSTDDVLIPLDRYPAF